MPHIKLTKTAIDKLPHPGKGQVLYWDTELTGFILRVTKSAKSFVVNCRVNGKPVSTTLGLYGRLTLTQARELAKAKLGEMAQGVNPNEQKREAIRQGVTLGQAYEAYIQERDLRPNTLRDYEKAMRKVFSDWHNLPLVSLTRSMVEDRFDSHSAPKLNESGEVVANNKAFAKQAFRFLSALLNWAREKYASDDDEPLLSSNPCERLTARKKWPTIKRRDNWVRPDQLPAFFQALEHKPHHTNKQKIVRDLCALYVLTGFRLTEGAGLRWADVDLKRKTLTITSERAKNHQKHELPIGDWLAAMFERYQQQNNSLPEPERSPFVFHHKDRNKHICRFDDVTKTISTECGVAFTVHDLRRSFVTIANNYVHGLSAYTLKRLVNHATDKADVTAGYIILDAETLRAPMQQIENFILRTARVLPTVEVTELVEIRKAG